VPATRAAEVGLCIEDRHSRGVEINCAEHAAKVRPAPPHVLNRPAMLSCA
jgi:hypothetical protein